MSSAASAIASHAQEGGGSLKPPQKQHSQAWYAARHRRHILDRIDLISRWQKSAPPWARYVGEAVATIGLYVLAFGIHLAVSPPPLVFLERDVGLSFPLTRPETVPMKYLFIISLSVPTAFILMGHLMQALRRNSSISNVLQSLLWTLLGLAQALAIVFAITNILKMMAGRQRPNFYALCDYAGYRDAVQSGNMTAYEAATYPGALGDLSKCRAPFADVAESLRSFPSGHSSISFSGMSYASLYLRAAFKVRKGVSVSILSIMATTPLIVSSYIAISRVRDRWHNTGA